MQELFDKYPEWVGMPEFEQTKVKPFKELTIRFATENDYIDFQRAIGQTLTIKTKSIWHPFRSHWGLDRKVYKDES